jgi:hypothetical protein
MQNERSIKSVNFEESDHANLTSDAFTNLNLLPNLKASSISNDFERGETETKQVANLEPLLHSESRISI